MTRKLVWQLCSLLTNLGLPRPEGRNTGTLALKVQPPIGENRMRRLCFVGPLGTAIMVITLPLVLINWWSGLIVKLGAFTQTTSTPPLPTPPPHTNLYGRCSDEVVPLTRSSAIPRTPVDELP